MPRWEATARRLLDGTPDGARLVRTCFVVLRFLHANDWRGACHASTAVRHVLLQAQGIPSTPCTGEARIAPYLFYHSWLEVGGVCDVAVTLPLTQTTPPLAPVVRGLDVETGAPTVVEYSVRSDFPMDPATSVVRSLSFVEYMEYMEYMDGFPGVAHGPWGIVAGLARPCGLPPLDTLAVRTSYADTRWSPGAGAVG